MTTIDIRWTRVKMWHLESKVKVKQVHHNFVLGID